jgi:hypothetical protein
VPQSALKRWYLVSASPHGVTAQKSNIDIFTAVRASIVIYIQNRGYHMTLLKSSVLLTANTAILLCNRPYTNV